MYYFENETVMSLENALALKPREIAVLEHVRTYEYEEGDRPLAFFIEIRCLEYGVVVRKNEIVDFPEFRSIQEQQFPTLEEATVVFRQWIKEIRQ